MYKIDQITDEPKQNQTLILPDGSSLTLRIEFKPLQTGWFITELTQGDFTIMGQRIVTSPNILHQFYKQLTFGIACFVDGGQEPLFIGDFLSGRAELFLLDSDEVQEFEDFLNARAP